MTEVRTDEWLPELKYPGAPIQDRDEIYLQCYLNGDLGYVAMYEECKPSSTVLIQMSVNSRVEEKPSVSTYWATWVQQVYKRTEALTFTVRTENGKTWLEARKQDLGAVVPREFVCVPLQPWVQFDATQDKTLGHLHFTGGGHVGFSCKTRQIGLFAYKSCDGRWYLNTDAKGLECVFVPEKVLPEPNLATAW